MRFSNRHRRSLLGSLLVTSSLALAGAAYGQTTGTTGDMGATTITPNRAELPDSAFSKLDAGGKGYLTSDDTRALSGFDFGAGDRDHDGRLTADEFSKAWQSYSGNPIPGRDSSSGSNAPSTTGGAIAPRGGGVNGSTQTNGATRPSVPPMDSTTPAGKVPVPTGALSK